MNEAVHGRHILYDEGDGVLCFGVEIDVYHNM